MPPSLPSVLAHRASSATLFRIYRGKPLDPASWIQLSPTNHGAWMVYRGYAEIRISGRTTRVEAGQGLLIGFTPREQLLHKVEEMLSINYLWNDGDGRPVIPLVEPVVFPLETQVRMVNAAEQFQKIAALHVENPAVLLQTRRLSHGDYQKVTGLFHLWLAELAEMASLLGVEFSPDEPTDPRLARARLFLDDAPLNAPLDYGELACNSGISRAQLERLFRKQFHTTPHSYFERRRAEFACHKLLGCTMPIKEIAFCLGFRHLSRFSAWFCAREHHSPGEYRALGRLEAG